MFKSANFPGLSRQRKSALAGVHGRRGGLRLCCPALILNPVQIHITTYYYRNAQQISIEQAQDFLNRLSAGKTLPAGEYLLVRPPLKDHRLQVVAIDVMERCRKSVFKMPEWSVCFLQPETEVLKIERKSAKRNRSRQQTPILSGRKISFIAHKEQIFLVLLQDGEGALGAATKAGSG